MHWRANSKKLKPEAISRWLRFLANKGVRPGVPEYQKCRDMLMPIRVPLGQASAMDGGQTPYSEEGMEGFDKQTLRECRAKVETLSCNALFRHPWPLTVQGMLAWNMRLDCSQLGREARLLAAETVLDMLFETARATGPIPVNPRSDSERYRVFVIIDEVKVLSLGRGNNEDSRHILNVLVTEGRKYGIGLILASQMMSHFGSEVHAMVSSRLVHAENGSPGGQACGTSNGAHAGGFGIDGKPAGYGILPQCVNWRDGHAAN